MTTIKDVAQKAGVSTATVSRVINKRGALSDKTIEKVNKAMEELHYKPNTIARSLVKGKHYCIGVILPNLSSPFWSQMAHELEKAAAQRGYSIMITVAPDKKVSDYIERFEYLAASMPEGIITSYISNTEDYLYQSAVPFVIIGNTRFTPSVSSNDDQGGTLATRHLIAKGCRNLIHISGNLKGRSSGNARSFAFMRECEKRDIPYKIYQLNEAQLNELDFSGVISDIFYENSDFDGIFASNDILAAHCISTALSLGYKIPEDIRIIGYDDVNISPLIYPPLTTIHQDIGKLAKAAVDTLIQRVNGMEIPERQVFPVKLIERKTT